MRHKSKQTTAGYINYAEQIRPSVQELHVPAILQLPAPGVASERQPSAKAE